MSKGGEHGAEVVEAPGEVGEEGVGAVLGELAVDFDGLGGCFERLVAVSKGGEHGAEVVEAPGEVWEERVWAVLGELAVDFDDFGGRIERLFAASEGGEHVAELMEGFCQGGPVALRFELAVQGDGALEVVDLGLTLAESPVDPG